MTTTESLPVSVCIPVRNEERNLDTCLTAAKEAFGEIVVVDSCSTDQTVAIAERHGVKVIQFVWDGQFPKKRNWVLRNHRFQNPWVLFLDADEKVTPAFIAELRRILPKTDHVGFWLNFTNWFMGHPLHHGDVFRKIALIRVGKGEYERFPESFWSNLDMEVHEHPVLDGSVGEIHSKLEHRDFRGLQHVISKHNEYSTWEANRFRWFHTAATIEDWQRLNSRQRFKYRHMRKWWFASFYWLVSFILKSGFRDGIAGFRFSKVKKRYFEEVRLKIIESENASVQGIP